MLENVEKLLWDEKQNKKAKNKIRKGRKQKEKKKKKTQIICTP
jgi:hypothetical protein